MARLPYSRVKIAAEELVRSSSVPSSIVRATDSRRGEREDFAGPETLTA